jgi:D-sedoheptulose 7-phosphate isomerase
MASGLEEIAEGFRNAAASEYPAQMEAAARAIGDALERGHKLLAFGNGGSASDAIHLCGELVVRFQTHRRALPAIALVTNPAVLTACSNDYSYEQVFSRQVEALAKPGDVVLAISTSGESPSVIRALEKARAGKVFTILLTGSRDGRARQFCDLLVAAPHPVTARIQELHLAFYHLLCEELDERFTRL